MKFFGVTVVYPLQEGVFAGVDYKDYIVFANDSKQAREIGEAICNVGFEGAITSSFTTDLKPEIEYKWMRKAMKMLPPGLALRRRVIQRFNEIVDHLPGDGDAERIGITDLIRCD